MASGTKVVAWRWWEVIGFQIESEGGTNRGEGLNMKSLQDDWELSF